MGKQKAPLTTDTWGLDSNCIAQGLPGGYSCMTFSPLSEEGFPIPAAVAILWAAVMVDVELLCPQELKPSLAAWWMILEPLDSH